MAEFYLHKEDLEQILKFANDMDVETVLVRSDSSSGIGAIVTATAVTKMGDHSGEFTITISDETSW